MRNINDLRYAEDTTLMAESEEELKSLLLKVKEENEKADLKFNIPSDSPCPSGLSHMTLSWVGTPVLAPTNMLPWYAENTPSKHRKKSEKRR